MKLVPANCPNCGGGVRIDPGAETVTCDFCHTTSFVESPNRKPPSDARQVIRVAAPRSGGSNLFTLIAVSMVVLTGLGAGGVLLASAVTGAVITATKPAAPQFLTGDAPRIPALFEPHFGPDIQAGSLSLFEAHAVLVARVPDGFDEQFHVNGALVEPKPHTLSDPDDPTFPLASVDFSLVPGLIADAERRSGLSDGVADHVRFHRPLGAPLQISVFVEGARAKGNSHYDGSGNFLR